MKRIIKFRAWDKEKKRMIEVQEMYFNYENRWVVCGEIVDLDAPIMQYTGLKDKNGKEIYEGDIVAGISGGIAEVVYNPARFWLCPVDYMDNEGCNIVGDMDDNFSEGYCSIKTGNLEHLIVVGNIYENPELLKGDNQ